MRLLDRALAARTTAPRPAMPRLGLLTWGQAATVLVAGLLLSLLGVVVSRSYVEAEVREDRQELADAVRHAVETRTLVYTEVLRGVQSLLASGEVTRGGFHSYVERLQNNQRYVGLQAISFNRYVRAADREAFERRVRDDTSLRPEGNPLFSVHPRSDQPFSLVVDFIEPLEGNQRAFGFDVASDESRLRAALRARDTGLPQATVPLELVQETSAQMSILYFLPVYATGTSTQSVSERRSAFQGLVTAVIRMGDFMHGSLNPRQLASCDFEIRDAGLANTGAAPLGSAVVTLFANRIEQRDPDGTRGPSVEVPPIEVGGRNWQLVFHHLAVPTPAAVRRTPALVLTVGSVISLLAAAVVFMLGSRARAATAVQSLAADLAESARATRILTAVVADSLEGIVVTDHEGTILDVNEAWCRISGYSRAEALGKNPKLLQSEWQDRASYQHLWQSLTETGSWTGELWDRRKDGSVYAVRSSIRAVTDAEGHVTHYVGTQYDVTDYLESNERAMFLANHDALTGLPSRPMLLDRLGQALSEAKSRNRTVVLIYLDLDGFKPINDTLGHLAGDKVLQEVSRRLASCVRQHDTVARLGGDEFVVLLSSDVSRKRAKALVAQLSQYLAEPMFIFGRSVKLTASMGVALYPHDASEADLLLRLADMAMYTAKSSGAGQYHFASSASHTSVELRRALDDGQFELYYQPEVAIDSGLVTGFEALLRWRHPERGILLPADFLRDVESMECGSLIGEWVLSRACRQAREWEDVSSRQLTVAVNTFPSQLFDPTFGDMVRVALSASGLRPERLQLEIKEQDLLRLQGQSAKLLEDIASLGVRLTLDGFGSGTTPLSILNSRHVSRVKIHGPRVREALESEKSLEMLRAITLSVREFEIQVVAEGVETEEQLDLLKSLDCDAYVGRLYEGPLPASEVVSFMQQRTH